MKKHYFILFAAICLVAACLFPVNLTAGWEKLPDPYTKMWIFDYPPKDSSSLRINMFSVQADMVIAATDYGVWTTIDAGQHWSWVTNIPGFDSTFRDPYFPPNRYFNFAYANDNYIYVRGVINDNIDSEWRYIVSGWRSSDRGASWEPALEGWPSVFIADAIAQKDSLILVAGRKTIIGTEYIYPIYRSADNGLSFAEVGSGLPAADDYYSINVHGLTFHKGNSYLTVYTSNERINEMTVFTSADGINWGIAGLDTAIQNACMASAGDYLFVGHAGYNTCSYGYGIRRSADNGKTWTSCNNGLTTNNWQGINVRKLLTYGQTVFAALEPGSLPGQGGEIYFSTDYGDNWNYAGMMFPNGVDRMIVENGYLYAFGDTDFSWYRHIWRRKLSEIITSVEKSNPIVPTSSALSQNYPNPFNPATTIEFTLSKRGVTTLKVYDVVGREVAVLINKEVLEAGQHQARFNGAGLSSGLYIYQLSTTDFKCTKKMILQK